MHDPHPLPRTDAVVDGVRLSLSRHGQPGAPTVLLLHGFPTSSYLWHDVARDLGREHDVLACDLVGMGRSERPARSNYGLAEQARYMLGLLDSLGVARAVVAGHDLGGAVAVHMASAAPDRVRGLVLIDSPLHADAWATPAVFPLLLPGLGDAYAAAVRRAPSLARSILARALGTPPDPALSGREVAGYLQPLLSSDGARGLLRFARSVDLVSTESAWDTLRVAAPPTLVMWGENDHLHSLAYGRRIAAECPGAAWVPVADAGHLLPQQRPERVAEEIAGFIADLAETSGVGKLAETSGAGSRRETSASGTANALDPGSTGKL
jgi:pimeloyl-ACP methyl ester carboxylesterase